MSGAYYNEIDPYAAQWLRNLIAAGHIAPGEVDERSIEDVRPDDLRGFTQCHFFAGIGVWSHALRLAGWEDSRPAWTGSCPCQPFSAAGQGAGFADERHLWPAFHYLIEQCRPAIVFGEQVASKDADPWIDLVCTDLEAVGYAFGAVPFPAAGVGAPHIRDRLYWVADAGGARAGRDARAAPRAQAGLRRPGNPDGGEVGDALVIGRSVRRLARPSGERFNGESTCVRRPDEGGRNAADHVEAAGHGEGGRLGDAECGRLRIGGRKAADVADQSGDWSIHAIAACNPGTTNGHWRDADWLFCRDGKWRPVEPGTFPLVAGAAARVGRLRADQESETTLPRKDQGSRVGRLRAYGNAIVAQAATEFIKAVMTVTP